MDEGNLRGLLSKVRSGELEVEAAVERLKGFPYDDLGFATLDVQREVRRGFPEVIFGQRKTSEQIVAIAERLSTHHALVVATRLSAEAAAALQARFPSLAYHPEANLAAIVRPGTELAQRGDLIVVSAGTADLAVAEEAAWTATYMGNRVERVYDVGVSGLERILGRRTRLARARAIVVVAGMDGALPAVVAGLVPCPVVAVPTSVGYGAAFGGLAALLTMLNSCSSGVGVVNIDNGFGGAYLASLINHLGSD
ncbi:MAG: nickel pincer cofactor biosynthesis protein LarB [Chloroflexota bacterium]